MSETALRMKKTAEQIQTALLLCMTDIYKDIKIKGAFSYLLGIELEDAVKFIK